MQHALGFWRRQGGASAVEFALVVPPLIIMLLGAINFCIVLYANETLAYAAEEGARCMAVKTNVCPDVTTTQTYAAKMYKGPGISPTFTPTTTTCGGANGATGSQVVASGTYTLSLGIGAINVPLSATACFPNQ